MRPLHKSGNFDLDPQNPHMKRGAVADTRNPNSEERSMKTGPWRSLTSQIRCISEFWVRLKPQSFTMESNRRKTISTCDLHMQEYTDKHTHIHWQVHVHHTQSKPVCWQPWIAREIQNTRWITAKKLDVISCIVSVSNMAHKRQPPSSSCSNISLWGLSWPFYFNVVTHWVSLSSFPALFSPQQWYTPSLNIFFLRPFVLSLLPMSSLLGKYQSLYCLLRNLFSSARSVWNLACFLGNICWMNVQTRITIELTGALLRAECTEPPYTQQCLTHWTQQTLLGLLPASWIRKCVLSCLWGMQVSAGLLGWGGGPPRWGYLVPFYPVLVEHPWLSVLERVHVKQGLLSWKMSKDLTQLNPSGFENLSIYITLSSYIAQREKKILHIVYLLVCLFLRHPFSEKRL